MSDTENMMPELTLNADAAKVEAPMLTLDMGPEAPKVEEKKVEPVVIDDSMLSEAERRQVDEFAKKIDISNSQLVLNYGVAAQKSVAGFKSEAKRS